MLISILLTILSFVQINTLEFTAIIQYKQKFCFTEFIMESTPFHIQITNQNQNYDLKVFLKNGTRLFLRSEGKVKVINSYSAIEAEYEICIQNYQNTSQFSIKFYQGLELSDHKQLPKKGEGKIIQQLVNYLSELHQKIKVQDETNHKINEYNIQLQKLVSYKTVGFGFLSIAIILIISFLVYMSLKRIMRNKKLI